MEYQIAKPRDFLSQFVKQYWSFQNCLPSGQEHIQRIIPNGLFELIFYLDHKPSSSDAKKDISESVILSGQQKGFYDLRISEKLSLFAVYFHPHGLSVFLDLPLRELFNYSIPLRFLARDMVNSLEEDISRALTFSDRIRIVENFLLERICKTGQKHQYKSIKHTINLINQTKGIISIEQLAEESCSSRKQFERNFADVIGASPKQFLKIVRFQNAIYQKTSNNQQNLTEIAHQCGYYDQAHMINDFKNLSGLNPKQFFSNCEVVSDYFN